MTMTHPQTHSHPHDPPGRSLGLHNTYYAHSGAAGFRIANGASPPGPGTRPRTGGATWNKEATWSRETTRIKATSNPRSDADPSDPETREAAWTQATRNERSDRERSDPEPEERRRRT